MHPLGPTSDGSTANAARTGNYRGHQVSECQLLLYLVAIQALKAPLALVPDCAFMIESSEIVWGAPLEWSLLYRLLKKLFQR